MKAGILMWLLKFNLPYGSLFTTDKSIIPHCARIGCYMGSAPSTYVPTACCWVIGRFSVHHFIMSTGNTWAALPNVHFDLRMSTVRVGACADASLWTDKECLMKKAWHPDKSTHRGERGEELLPQSVLVHYGGRYLLPFKLLPRWLTVGTITIQQLKEE